MRRIAIGAIAAWLVSSSVLAAGISAKGIKAGANLANVVGGAVFDTASYKYRTGVAAGLFVEYGFSDLLAVQPELLYSMKGVRDQSVLLGDTWSTTWKFDYLELPLLAKIKFPARENVSSWVVVGPAAAILLSATKKWEYAGDSQVDNVKKTTKSFDLGLAAGAGFGVPAGKGELIVEGRYTFGLIPTDDSGAKRDIRNGVISITIGYSL